MGFYPDFYSIGIFCGFLRAFKALDKIVYTAISLQNTQFSSKSLKNSLESRKFTTLHTKILKIAIHFLISKLNFPKEKKFVVLPETPLHTALFQIGNQKSATHFNLYLKN